MGSLYWNNQGYGFGNQYATGNNNNNNNSSNTGYGSRSFDNGSNNQNMNNEGFQSSILDSVGMQGGDLAVMNSIGNAVMGGFQIWQGYQQNKLARESFNLQKEAYYTNLRNQQQSYNTNLQDRINGRHSSAERTQEQKDAEFNKNKLGD